MNPFRLRHARLLLVICSVVLFALSVHFVVRPRPLPSAAEEFRNWAALDLPATAQDLRHHYVSNGLDGSEVTFYFRCRPEDTERLIGALRLQPETSSHPNVTFLGPPFPGWPDPSIWKGGVLYSANTFDEAKMDQGRAHYCYLRTDARQEQVYLRFDNY